jgi:myosin-crossreactive antigen
MEKITPESSKNFSMIDQFIEVIGDGIKSQKLPGRTI